MLAAWIDDHAFPFSQLLYFQHTLHVIDPNVDWIVLVLIFRVRGDMEADKCTFLTIHSVSASRQALVPLVVVMSLLADTLSHAHAHGVKVPSVRLNFVVRTTMARSKFMGVWMNG